MIQNGQCQGSADMPPHHKLAAWKDAGLAEMWGRGRGGGGGAGFTSVWPARCRMTVRMLLLVFGPELNAGGTSVVVM